MLNAITNIMENAGVSFAVGVFIMAVLGGIIFFARSWSIGLIINFIIFGGLFVWFYEAGYDYSKILWMFFIFLILMAFTLYYTSKAGTEGGYV